MSLTLIFLFLGAFLSALSGAAVLSIARSAIQEIEGFMLFLISSVLFSGGCIVDAIRRSKKVT